MDSRAERHDADLSLIAYLSVVGGIFAAFAMFMYWLFQPMQIANAGMAAYQPPPAAVLILPPSNAPTIETESPADLAAAEANQKELAPAAATETRPPEQPKRDVQARARKPERPAARRQREEDWRNWGNPQQNWGYAQHSLGRYERWF